MFKILAPLTALLRQAAQRPFLAPCECCTAQDAICEACEALAMASAYSDLPMRWPDGRLEWPQRP